MSAGLRNASSTANAAAITTSAPTTKAVSVCGRIHSSMRLVADTTPADRGAEACGSRSVLALDRTERHVLLSVLGDPPSALKGDREAGVRAEGGTPGWSC